MREWKDGQGCECECGRRESFGRQVNLLIDGLPCNTIWGPREISRFIYCLPYLIDK